MKIVTDKGFEIEVSELSVLNVRQGDLLIYRPSEKLTERSCEQLMQVVKFLEDCFEGVKVLMISATDEVVLARKMDDVDDEG